MPILKGVGLSIYLDALCAIVNHTTQVSRPVSRLNINHNVVLRNHRSCWPPDHWPHGVHVRVCARACSTGQA